MHEPFGVLHLLPTLSLGGAELHVARLVAGWKEGPTRPVVVAMHRGGPTEELLRAEQVPTHVLGIQRAPIRRPLAALRDARRLQHATLELARALVRDHGAALLQTHLSDADWLGLSVGRKLRLPVIVTCHDPHLLPQERRTDEWRTWLRRRLQARLWRRADAFIAVGAEVVRAIEKVPGVEPARIHLIQSGLVSRPLPDAAERAALRRKHAALLGEGARPAVLLAVGRLVENKGFHHVIEAFARVRSRAPRTRLLIAGDGPERPALEAQIVRLGLVEAVQLIGTRTDLRELLACADLFVTGTRYEGLGLAAAEALDQQVAVVGFRVSGIEEVVEHERSGLLVPHADVPVLADAIVALLGDPARRRAFGEHGRLSAQRFEISRGRAQAIALYCEVLERYGRATR